MSSELSPGSISFLHYPVIRDSVAKAMHCPDEELEINIVEVYIKEEFSLLNFIQFLFNAMVHELGLLLSKKYHNTFTIALDKVERAIDRASIRSYNTILGKKAKANNLQRRAFRQWHAAAKEKKAVKKIIRGIENRKDNISKLQEQIDAIQRSHDEFKSKLLEDLPLIGKELATAESELKELTAPIKMLGTKFSKLFGDNTQDDTRKEQIDTLYKRINILKTKLQFTRDEEAHLSSAPLEEIHPETSKLLKAIELNRRDIEILQKKLDSLEKSSPLEMAPQISAPPTPPPALIPVEEFLHHILTSIHPEMKELWRIFFEKFDSEAITAYQFSTETSEFKITLASPLKLWVPKLQPSDPEGGSILIFGMNNSVTGKFDRQNKSITFSEGFYIHCKYKLGFIPMKVSPKVYSVTYVSREDISMDAGMMGKIEKRSKSFSEYQKAWEDMSEVVLEDPSAFLEKK